jgi:hypothetical protein
VSSNPTEAKLGRRGKKICVPVCVTRRRNLIYIGMYFLCALIVFNVGQSGPTFFFPWAKSGFSVGPKGQETPSTTYRVIQNDSSDLK